MATYKLIQDIEAEDHILGPLTLRQFIYGLVCAFCLYMCFIGLTKHVWPLVAMFLPIAVLSGFFAFPFGKDQPTEVWALAKIRFLFMPRRRIWNQSGVKQLVTITAPKKIEHTYTDGLSQTEVRSRLKALANTLDSRGWAIKNVNLNMFNQPQMVTGGSDRLIDIGTMPRPVPEYDVQASDDILDERNNPVAQQFNQMITASTQSHRQQLMDEMNSVRQASDNAQQGGWFMGQSATASPVAADVTPEEAAVVEKVKRKKHDDATAKSHLRTIQPLGAGGKKRPARSTDQALADKGGSTSGKKPDPAILELANNNDLNVATLARQAHKAKNPEDLSDGEVIIPLH